MVMVAPDHFVTLDLPVAKVSLDTLKRQYYRLALRVHPDKNKEADASLAFKKLSQAYESLGGGGIAEDAKVLQAAYLVDIQGKCDSASRGWKRPRTPGAASSSSSPPPPPTRQTKSASSDPEPQSTRKGKSFDEILREYEAMEHAFNAQNDEQQNAHRARQISRSQRREKEAGVHTLALGKTVAALEPGADDRASSWRAFNKGSRSRDKSSGGGNDSAEQQKADNADGNQPMDSIRAEPEKKAACCLLCRRSFLGSAALEKHCAFSALHKSNLCLLERRREETTEIDQQAAV